MKLAVIGTGYVGLVTGTCFSETGNDVTCVDIDLEKVKRLQQGEIPIFEPGLDLIFHRNVSKGRLHFTSDLEKAITDAQIIFLALPTPPGADHSADLSFVLSAAEQISKLITSYKVIVDKSTVPVGTSEKVREVMSQHTNIPFDVVSNPEFLREGVAVEDFLKPDRVVIGTSSDTARKWMEQLYEPFVRQGNPIIFMDERSAEMTKYAANAYLATKISFMNEIANLCELTGADVDKVRIGIGSDTRIGKRFLFPRVGFGGSCFPKDVMALAKTAKDNAYDFRILNAVIEVNKNQREFFLQKVTKFFKGDLQSKKIAIWGLAFKPNTDDIREAPAVYIINDLLALGVEVHAYDPEAMENVAKRFGNQVQFAEDQYEVLKDAEALIIITEWSEFRSPDFEKMSSYLKSKVIFDGRNVFSVDDMREKGFYYESIGRLTVHA